MKKNYWVFATCAGKVRFRASPTEAAILALVQELLAQGWAVQTGETEDFSMEYRP